ncbi:MAG: transposase [Fidelibacterota bacterium]
MEKKQTRTQYDRDFKVSAIKLILEKHQSISKVPRNLGVGQNSLHKWKKAVIFPD